MDIDDNDVKIIVEHFPRLKESGFKPTSEKSQFYNCIAWVVRDLERHWWPVKNPDYYWPINEYEVTVACFIDAFKTLGYEICNGSEFERGFQKIAIYVTNDGKPRHVAIQIAPSIWSSKCGNFIDISHTLEGLEGRIFGQATVFMKRKMNCA